MPATTEQRYFNFIKEFFSFLYLCTVSIYSDTVILWVLKELEYIPVEQSKGGAASDRITVIHFFVGSLKCGSLAETDILKHSNLQ